MSLHRLLLWVSNSILFSVQEHCFLSFWQQKPSERKNNAPTFLVFSFLLFRQNSFLLLSSLSFRTCKPPLFVPAMPHCALFNPSCPFRSITCWHVISYSILLQTDLHTKQTQWYVQKDASHYPEWCRASASLAPSDGHSQGSVGILHRHLLWLFCFYFNYFCLGKLCLFIILKFVKLAQCWEKKHAAIVPQLSFQFIFLHMLFLIMENSINFICSWWNSS